MRRITSSMLATAMARPTWTCAVSRALFSRIFGAPRDDGSSRNSRNAHQHVAQRQQLRLAAVERDHVGAEARLQRGEAPQLVQHHIGDRVALQLDHDPHAVAVALVAQVRDAFDLLLAHEFGDAFDQRRLVDLIRDLADDQRLAVLAKGFGPDLSPHDDGAAPGGIGRADAGAAENRAAGREIRTEDDLHQLFDVHVGLGHQREDGVDGLAEIVRRDVGRHADGDAAGAVDEQIGKRAGRTDGSSFLLVVVGTEIDGVLVEILEQRHRNLFEPRLGVSHRRGAVAVDRAEIALSVDQRQAHREILRHAHHRVIDRDCRHADDTCR